MHQIHSEYLRELQANQSLDYGALLYYCAQLLEKEKGRSHLLSAIMEVLDD